MKVYYSLAFLCPLFLVVKRAADEILAEAKKPRIEVRTVLSVQIGGGGRLHQVLIYFYIFIYIQLGSLSSLVCM